MKAKTLLLASAIACGSLPALIGGAHATEAKIVPVNLVEEVGGSQRIDLSGKLRMLSQRIPAMACAHEAGIESEKSGTMLQGALVEFETIVKALTEGDDSLGIPVEETDRRVLKRVDELRELWDPVQVKMSGLSNDAVDTAVVGDLAEMAGPLLGRAQSLVDEITAEHSDPSALLQSDAITIGIAGRQRMLAQRMSKTSCLIAEDYATDGVMEELTATMETFDTSLNALRFGLPAAGIQAPSDDGIIAGLDEVAGDWATLKSLLGNIKDGSDVTTEQRGAMFNGLNGLTAKMNKVVGLYAITSKLEI